MDLWVVAMDSWVVNIYLQVVDSLFIYMGNIACKHYGILHFYVVHDNTTILLCR